MLIKAKDLQVGDVIAGYKVESLDLTTYNHFVEFMLQSPNFSTMTCLPKEMQIKVDRIEYVKASKNLIVSAARYLRIEGYCSTAWELEALLENSTTEC